MFCLERSLKMLYKVIHKLLFKLFKNINGIKDNFTCLI